ncbi:MAG: hypothetical protein IIC26_06745, partial [Chloroflexi bacterium]|nr:hypothetical protein [Chloroflexota bacterium]
IAAILNAHVPEVVTADVRRIHVDEVFKDVLGSNAVIADDVKVTTERRIECLWVLGHYKRSRVA